MRVRTGLSTVAEQVLTESLSDVALGFEPKVTYCTKPFRLGYH